MLTKNDALTAEEARHLFNYDPATGALTWRNPTQRAVAVGDVPGSVSKKGYRAISIYNRIFLAHRIVWLIVHGELPVANIVAKNGDFCDLRIENLTTETFADTARKASRKTNASGGRGVHYEAHTKKWRAEITRNYERIQLGRFDTREDAQAAYDAARRRDVGPVSPELRAKRAAASAQQGRMRYLWDRTQKENDGLTGWSSYVEFSRSLGHDVPRYSRVVKIDNAQMIGPDNFRVEPIPTANRQVRDGAQTYFRDRAQTSRERYRGHELRKNFGIEYEDYARMLLEQNGVCAICNKPETAVKYGRIMMLAVDHDHTTGAIRGLLCRNCNSGIGQFMERPDLLRSAADYVRKHAGGVDAASNVVPLKKER